MSDPVGKFCWYELMTTDSAAATAFYESVVGWGAQDSGVPGTAYTLLTVEGAPIGGLMATPEEARKAGVRPGWVGYVWVGDVDAGAARVAAAGGSVHRVPDDIPGVGRFSVVADPQGAVFVLFKNAGGGRPPSPAAGTPGLPSWHELHASDRESAFSFYADLFGWTKAEAFNMGDPVGIYQLFTTGDAPVGGMMNKLDVFPRPFWLYYFCVDDIDAAVGRVTGGGGQVINGPHEVPGGSWIIQGLDPQGAMFALVGPRRAAAS
jgi:predicted enzyme related to lactoylglutathione lyase